MGYTTVDLESIEPSGPGDAVRFVRRELGATAFGVNHFTLPPGVTGREHDEVTSGQEEVMIVLSPSSPSTRSTPEPESTIMTSS